MKNLGKLVYISLILLLSSCGASRWGNFNKQKHTKLKKIKSSDKNLTENKNEETIAYEQVLDNSKVDTSKSHKETTNEIVNESIASTVNVETVVLSNPENRDSIQRAIEEGYDFYVHLNGGYYKLNNPQIDPTTNTLTGDLVSANSNSSSKNYIELNVSDYDLFQLSGLIANLDNVEINSINPPLYFEQTNIINNSNQNDSTNSTVNSDQSKKIVSNYSEKKGIKFFGAAIVFLLMALSGGLILIFLSWSFATLGVILLIAGFIALYCLLTASAIHLRRDRLQKKQHNQPISNKANIFNILTWLLLTFISLPLLFIPLLIALLIVLTQARKVQL